MSANTIYSTAHLPLGWEVTISSGNTDYESVKASQDVGCNDGIIRLRGRMHLGEDFLGQCFGDPKQELHVITQYRNGYV